MKVAITADEATRFRRLDYTRRGLDSTLRVQMERSMELYADLTEDTQAFWRELAAIYKLPIDVSMELITEDHGSTFFIQERQRRKDSASDKDEIARRKDP